MQYVTSTRAYSYMSYKKVVVRFPLHVRVSSLSGKDIKPANKAVKHFLFGRKLEACHTVISRQV